MTSALVHRLRSYSEAYPLDMFPELTKDEREMLHREHPGFLDRISASMGRHCAKVMDQAADVIEGIPVQQTGPQHPIVKDFQDTIGQPNKLLGALKPAHEREPPHCASCTCAGPLDDAQLVKLLQEISKR